MDPIPREIPSKPRDLRPNLGFGWMHLNLHLDIVSRFDFGFGTGTGLVSILGLGPVHSMPRDNRWIGRVRTMWARHFGEWTLGFGFGLVVEAKSINWVFGNGIS